MPAMSPLISVHALYDKGVSGGIGFHGMSSSDYANCTANKASPLTYAAYVELAASLGMSNKLLIYRSWWRPHHHEPSLSES